MRVLHILTGGHAGGIETLCREIGKKSIHENGFCFMSFGGEIYEQMMEMGLKVYPLYKTGRKWSFNKVAKLLRLAENYDIVVVHHEDPFIELYFLIVVFIRHLPGVRYVHSCYGDEMQLDKNSIKKVLKKVIRQRSISAAARIIFVSEAGKESCEKIYHFDEKKSRVIYNGIADKYLLEGKRHLIKIEKPVEILYVGRLVGIKGIDNLLKAFERLKRDFSVHLSLVGDGEQRRILQELSDQLQLVWKEGAVEGSDVTFYGVQTDITQFYKKASLFIYPSVCQEIFGLSIIEAMAFGVPCISNCVGGIPEVIADRKNGFLTKTSDVDGLYTTMKLAFDIMEDKDAFNIMSKEAKKTAGRFSIENTCHQLDKEIAKLSGKN